MKLKQVTYEEFDNHMSKCRNVNIKIQGHNSDWYDLLTGELLGKSTYDNYYINIETYDGCEDYNFELDL